MLKSYQVVLTACYITCSSAYVFAQPVCDIQLNQESFMPGDQVSAPVYRIQNPDSTATPVEVKVSLENPTGPATSFANQGADGNLTLPPGFNRNFGPVDLFTASTLGQYAFNCRVLNPVTGELLTQDLNPFVVGNFNFADYYPLDPLKTCVDTMEMTVGPAIGTQYTVTIGGTDTVNYQTGALTGVNISYEDGTTILAYNNGSSFKYLKFSNGASSVYLSSDCNLTSPPQEWSFGAIYDGMIKDQTTPNYQINTSNPLDCVVADTASQKILIKIQDVTVQGVLHPNAVVMYWLDLDFTFPASGLNFSGKDVELGLLLPTGADTEGAGPTGIEIYSAGGRSIAGGDIAASTGVLQDFSERVATSCP